MKTFLVQLEKRTRVFNNKTMEHMDSTPYFVEKMGSSNTLRIDGRLNIESIHNIATKKAWQFYKIIKCNSLLDNELIQYISKIKE